MKRQMLLEDKENYLDGYLGHLAPKFIGTGGRLLHGANQCLGR